MITIDKIKEKYFLFGCIEDNYHADIQEKLKSFNGNVYYFPIVGYGKYFYTLPFYADFAENDEIVLIKLGNFHDGQELISAQSILDNRWLTESNLIFQNIMGDGALISFNKTSPQCLIYRNVLSASSIHYLNQSDKLITSDNLRLVSLFQGNSELSEEGLVQHFMSRHTFGRDTYFKGISKLMVGEMLRWKPSNLTVDIKSGLKNFFNSDNYKSVTKETSGMYFEKLKEIVGIYLNGREKSSAMLLSGGIDSSLVQAAINSNLDSQVNFPSFSYVIESPGFAYEVDYAKDASIALNTQHTFIELSPDQYVQGMIHAIEILGEPPTDDVRFCFHLVSDYLSSNYPEIKSVFHGAFADGFNGGSTASKAVQGDKYRSWPVPLLEFLAKALLPISRSKSYGAKTAADFLRSTKNINSKDYYLNSIDVYTDWEMLEKCFSPDIVNEVLRRKRAIENEFIDSKFFVEKVTMLDTLVSGLRQHSMERSLGYFNNIEFVYPFGDESVIKAGCSFSPKERYLNNHRTKPILKLSLESQTSDFELDKPKGWSGYGMDELFVSMRAGELSGLVKNIERPGFMSKADFKQKLERPDWFTWNLLTMDVFKKEVLGD